LISRIESLYFIRQAKLSRLDGAKLGYLFLVDSHLPLLNPIIVSNNSNNQGFYTNAWELISGIEWENLSRRYS
jgi:hypothetical protein